MKLVTDIVTDRLFDGRRFRDEPTRLWLDGGRISRIERYGGEALPDGTLDLRGGTLMPGFIDAHAHVGRAGQFEAHEPPNPLAIAHNLRMALAGGVTTVGDMGGPAPLAASLRSATEATPIAGPALRVSGPMLADPLGYPLDWISPSHRRLGVVEVCGDERGARAAVARVAAAGMDHLKLCIMHHSYAQKPLSVFSRSVARAIVNEAHQLGLRAFAHAHSAADYRLALDAGVDALMHSSFDALDDEIVARTRDAGVVVCPTLWVFHSACLGAEQRWDRDPSRRGRVVGAVARSWTRFAEAYAESGEILPPGIAGGLPKERAKEGARVAMANLKLLRDAAVPFAYGSDGPYGFSVLGRPLDELSVLRDAGLDVDECLRAATSGAASLLGCGDRGMVEPGMRCDLVVVDGDPREDFKAIGRVRAVIRGGELMRIASRNIGAGLARAGAVASGLARTVATALGQR